MASCALLSAGGGTGDTDATSQVDVEPIGTYPGNESSFREIVRLKWNIKTSAEAEVACLEKMVDHMKEHHTAKCHEPREVLPNVLGSSACHAVGRSTGKGCHDEVELCDTLSGSDQSETVKKRRTRKANGGGRGVSGREEMVKLVNDMQTRDQRKRAMWERWKSHLWETTWYHILQDTTTFSRR